MERCLQRKKNRLAEYDYSAPGAYFITVCAKEKAHLFGEISNGHMRLTDIGTIVDQEIMALRSRYAAVRVDKYVVMPNHIHLLITLAERINPFPTGACDIPNIIGKFKAGVTRRVGNAFMHSAAKTIWQTSYHDHIIRDRADYDAIWKYIDQNVLRWELDCFYNV